MYVQAGGQCEEMMGMENRRTVSFYFLKSDFIRLLHNMKGTEKEYNESIAQLQYFEVCPRHTHTNTHTLFFVCFPRTLFCFLATPAARRSSSPEIEPEP